jgi:hypothetical protein
MKNYIYTIAAIFGMVLFSSCEEDLTLATIAAPEDIVASSLSDFSASNYTLEFENKAQVFENFTWTSANYGYSAAIKYTLQVDVAGNKFANTINLGTNAINSIELTVGQINKGLTNLGLVPFEATTIEIRVKAEVDGAIESTYSNVISANITTYSTTLDLSTPWGLVGDATPNSWNGPDVPFYKTNTENEYVAYPTLVNGFVKIRKDNDWAVNYGDANLDGVLDTDNDNNIAVTAGVYKVTFNEVTLAYSIEEFTWGLVGDATPNGWNGPDLALEYDPTSDTWRNIVSLTDGFIKIRQNNDWAVNYGDATLDGVLDGDNDNNIAVTAGNYLVTVNTTTLEYSLEAIDVWGIVGDATPNGWNGPDTKFKLDYSQEGVWYLNNITLTAGAIKFRTNDDWGLNYGDATLDGILDGDNDNNISVTAGVYSFTLDFSDPNTPKYTMTKN